MLETMASIDGPVLALLDEIAQELSGFGSGNKAAEKFSDRSLAVHQEDGRTTRAIPEARKYAARRSHEKQDRKKHPSGCIVRYRQAKSVRSGARRFLETPGGKDKWTEAGDYKGLTDTAETYAEHEASAFEKSSWTTTMTTTGSTLSQ